MQVLADRGRAATMEIDGAWWMDVDDPHAHALAEAEGGPAGEGRGQGRELRTSPDGTLRQFWHGPIVTLFGLASDRRLQYPLALAQSVRGSILDLGPALGKSDLIGDIAPLAQHDWAVDPGASQPTGLSCHDVGEQAVDRQARQATDSGVQLHRHPRPVRVGVLGVQICAAQATGLPGNHQWAGDGPVAGNPILACAPGIAPAMHKLF